MLNNNTLKVGAEFDDGDIIDKCQEIIAHANMTAE